MLWPEFFLGTTRVLRPTGHCGRPALRLSTRISNSRLVGLRASPALLRHSKVAPQISMRVPSISSLDSLGILLPFVGADLLSLSPYIPPPTLTSRHTPGSPVTRLGSSAPQNEVWGCMISTPLVVSPSTPWCSVSHLVAFSPRKMFLLESNPAAKMLAAESVSSREEIILQANLDMVDWAAALLGS